MPVMPTDVFDIYIKRSILKEGNDTFTDDPADSGGGTRWGVTEARARAAGYTGDMRTLPYQTAYNIYKLFYWQQPGFDKIVNTDPTLAEYMLDIGINRGASVPSKWLQRTLNVLNNGGTLYGDILVDGLAGAMTQYALVKFVTFRGQDGMALLMNVMRSLAAVDYITIAEGNHSQEKWEYGWLERAFAPV